MNVLKPHLQTTIWTLLAANASQREIERVTGIDHKTIRGNRGLLVFSALSDDKGAAKHAASNASSLASPCRAWPFCHPSNRAGAAPAVGRF